ncbi:hypothetical protein [Butyrivibrio sp. XPD2006]|uniref:hypothetical protein n=1 Tax=Butyrivibrio sp. XPD2006 TaxID=1280668 RepID=UPI0003B4398A|nr:hypothetical protein [Butyrivibrio sp. XPD2006]
MKRKLIAIAMTMTMVMALSACGKSAEVDEPAVEVQAEESAEATAEESVEASSEDEKSLEEQAAEVSAEGEAPQAEMEEAGEFSVGTVEGNSYVNEYFGVKLNLLDGYAFVDDEALAQITGLTADMLSDNKLLAKAIEDGTATIIAYAADSTGLNNVNVTVQSNASLANAILDEEAVLVASVGQAKSALEAQGISNITYDVVEKEVAGENHKVLKMNGEFNGIEFHNEMVNLQKGDYMLAFAATSFNGDSTDAMIDAVEALN